MLFLLSTTLKAQLTVVSSTPANGSVGVPLNTEVSITFNAPLDTSVVRFHEGNFLITNLFDNIGDISPDAMTISSDRQTVTFSIPLTANKNYFLYLLP